MTAAELLASINTDDCRIVGLIIEADTDDPLKRKLALSNLAALLTEVQNARRAPLTPRLVEVFDGR